MPDESTFSDLIARVRAGDQKAATLLVARYEGAIRREARMNLTDKRLRRVFDSGDLCQVVLASFFVRAALGQYELDTPGQLIGLLARIAHNKVVDQMKHHHAQRHGGGQAHEPLPGGADQSERIIPGSDPSPSRHVAGKELLEHVLKHLTAEERQMIEWRQQGIGWDEIASRLGGSPDGRRKQLERAVERVAQEIGLDSLLTS